MSAGRYPSLFEPAVWERALRALVASNGIGDAVLTLQAQASRRDNRGAAQRDNRAAVLLELLDAQREEPA